ncbi:MAG: hypothetical protein ACRCUJ_07520, partial [Phocaeicola sp.]
AIAEILQHITFLSLVYAIIITRNWVVVYGYFTAINPVTTKITPYDIDTENDRIRIMIHALRLYLALQYSHKQLSPKHTT